MLAIFAKFTLFTSCEGLKPDNPTTALRLQTVRKRCKLAPTGSPISECSYTFCVHLLAPNSHRKVTSERDVLKHRIKEHQFLADALQRHLDTRRYGTVPAAASAWASNTLWPCGLDHVSETSTSARHAPRILHAIPVDFDSEQRGLLPNHLDLASLLTIVRSDCTTFPSLQEARYRCDLERI